MQTKNTNKRLRLLYVFLACLSIITLLLNITAIHGLAEEGISPPADQTPAAPELAPEAAWKYFLPVVSGVTKPVPVMNVPYFNGTIKGAETSVFWFGKVTADDNAADVRLGYNNDNLWVRISIIDRRLWYDPTPALAEMPNWDAASVYLDLANSSGSLGSRQYRFDAELTWWEARTNFQTAYQGSSSGWVNSSLGFTTKTQWWGFPEPNDDKDDRGWKVEFTIPFKNLGLSGPPGISAKWRLAVQVHDRDNAQDSPSIPATAWPAGMKSDQPGSWEQISFGLPSYQAPYAKNSQTISLRNGLNGITVLDGVVGGNTDCGSGLSLWSDWGNHAYPGTRDLNVQNQGNTDDWPCFSRVYLTFPLTSLPRNKVIVSATLTLHQNGQSTGFASDPVEAKNSLIQVFRVERGWDEATLSWNNAPLPLENVGQAWVGEITMADLGLARTWDLSRAVASAYDRGEPLYLALYSADFYGPHGKYFYSSDSTPNDGAYRPQLDITLGDP